MSFDKINLLLIKTNHHEKAIHTSARYFHSSSFDLQLQTQWVSIPDTGFVQHLRTHGYASCFTGSNQTGWQMDTTCAAVVNANHIEINGLDVVSDVTGIQYFDNLTWFSIGVNPITFIPALPEGLDTLYLWRNGPLTSLPAHLPTGLIQLYIESEFLSAPPNLPVGLQDLIYFSSSLTSLPILPSGLKTLNCSSNLLTTLPTLPSGLLVLNCGGNQLSALPALPAGLTDLLCSINPLGSLPNPLPATDIYKKTKREQTETSMQVRCLREAGLVKKNR
jgi:hypothetical protein